jgi:hypothetical protein
MAYFEDLTVHTYSSDAEPGALNVGWLSKDAYFETGKSPEIFRAALDKLCSDNAMNFCWGHHVCEFCPEARFGDSFFIEMGNGEVRVRDSGGTWYVAPRLVGHYVAEHDYLPPQDFIDSVLNPNEIGKESEIPPLTYEEEIKQSRELLQRERELRGPPITKSEIDEFVRTGTRRKLRTKRWWQFWR